MTDLASHFRTKTVLVVDDNGFHRRIAAEALRAIGAGDVVLCANVPEAVESMQRNTFGLIMTDWAMEPIDGVAFTRGLRDGLYGEPHRRVPIIMATANATHAHLDTAQNAGADEYLLKSFNTKALVTRLEAVFFSRRPFIESDVYVGPCRRRRWTADYDGPLRRLFDEDRDEADAKEAEIKRNLAKVKIDQAVTLVKGLTAQDRKRVRETYLITADITALAREMKDKVLTTACVSLTQYIAAVGATTRFDGKVVEAHLEAMQQLIALHKMPNDVREKLSGALNALVERKLRRA